MPLPLVSEHCGSAGAHTPAVPAAKGCRCSPVCPGYPFSVSLAPGQWRGPVGKADSFSDVAAAAPLLSSACSSLRPLPAHCHHLYRRFVSHKCFSLHLSKHTCLKRLLSKQRIIQTALQGSHCLSLCLDLGTSGLSTRALERREWQGNTCPLGPCFCHLCSSHYPGGTTSPMKSSSLAAQLQHSPMPFVLNWLSQVTSSDAIET